MAAVRGLNGKEPDMKVDELMAVVKRCCDAACEDASMTYWSTNFQGQKID